VVLQEDAGKNDTVSNNKIQLAVPFNLTVTSGSDDPFRFKSDNSATAYVWYRGLRDSTLGSKEIVFVTERGTRAVSMGTTDATYRVAKKIGMPTFQFAYSDTAVSTSGEEYVMKVGDSKVFGGVTVKVKAIDASSGSCSVLGPNGAPACSVDSTGVMAVISPNNAPSVEVSEPYKLSSSLVMMDSAGPSAGVAILVGGPEVNMMTKAALEGSNVDFNVDTVVVKEIGNKIVVAGKTASDTMAAADQFIAGVKRQ
jgi:hypothetical protein